LHDEIKASSGQESLLELTKVDTSEDLPKIEASQTVDILHQGKMLGSEVPLETHFPDENYSIP
jgi:hypothetical protein